MSIVSLKNITKKYGDKYLFKDFSLDVNEGDFLSITGISGSGKTTLLNMIGLIEKPDSGKIMLFNTKNAHFDSKQARDLRKKQMAYLFQNYGLVDNETCEFNLNMSLEFSDLDKNQKKDVIAKALAKVGLQDFEKRKIFSLSGGEQQRIALAKIIIKDPELILADEPTGSLDSDNRDFVLSILKELNEKGKTIIIVTHDSKVDSCAKKHLSL